METTEAIAALPDDALAGVLGVLPPRSLAVAQCVCKAWRDIINARALLRRHLLPHSVRGVFINYIDHDRPHLFSRPSSSSSTFPGIDGMLSFLPNDPIRDWWEGPGPLQRPRALQHRVGAPPLRVQPGDAAVDAASRAQPRKRHLPRF
jgi:hypothetical protein